MCLVEKVMANVNWKKFPCNKAELCLDTVLVCGQSFRWKKNGLGEWLGVLAGLVWRLKQTDGEILYQVYGKDATHIACGDKDPTTKSQVKIKPLNAISLKHKAENLDEVNLGDAETEIKSTSRNKKNKKSSVNIEKLKWQTESADLNISLEGTHHHSLSSNVEDNTEHTDEHLFSLLHNYFQLGVNLEALYKSWASKDPHFSEVAVDFCGIRMLRQDPVENLFSFVCSSNNNISRISNMVENLCTHYGELITRVDDTDYFAFPTISSLCTDDIETKLRHLGFGYRAKFIARIAKDIVEKKDEGWLNSLRGKPYSEAKAELLTLYGVGAKVADCVCLMSLDKSEAVPVDTHVWQITMKHYMAKLQSAKSLTEKLYNEIGDFYRNLWGTYAGWAHSVLFTADLRHNKRKGEDETSEKCAARKKSHKTSNIKKKKN